MNFNFTKVSLPTLTTPKPVELLKLLDRPQGTPSNSRLSSLHDLPDLDFSHLRNLAEIIDAIESGRSNSIQLLEWLYCIYYKSEWDVLYPDRSLLTSQKIWLLAKQIKPLKKILFWDLALFYGESESSRFANSLVESFKSFVAESIDDRKIVRFIKILASSSPEIGIASTSKQYLLTPHRLFNQYNLPTHRIKSLILVYDLIADLFIGIEKPNDKQVKWLLDCLEQMTVEQEVKAIDRLLSTIGAEIGIEHPDLVNWISVRYRLGSDTYRWNQLSISAREALRKWEGAVNYGDFQKLIDIILYQSQIDLKEHERNQLQKRQVFWSHYTDRFDRIRILLPQSSLPSVKASLSSQDLCVLEDDGSQTEVCIFDFKEWLVVEFFRGSSSETRIFSKTFELEKTLFESNHLSASKIRHLGGDIHDHVYCWQNSCVKWLMEKGISPNEGTKFFKGIPMKGSNYNPNIGLPTLQKEDRQKRERALIKWKQSLNIVERPLITISRPTY
jgi:EH_Signature domain